MPKTVQLDRHSSLLTLAALTLSCTLTACRPTPPPTTSTTPAPSQPAVMSSAARAAAATLAARHPAFKVFLQKPDLPTILTVAESTTDDQLKSLLWYLRIEVQSGHFKQLGLNPTATTYGAPNYLSGDLTVYRGAQCAREMYLAPAPGPCGDTTSHNAASYHWGTGNNPRTDEADLFDASRKVTDVFDSSDHWQTEAEAAADPAGTKAAATQKRLDYATAQTAKQSRQHTDIRFFLTEPTTQLNAISYQFATPEARARFTREFTTLESDHLCVLGFQSLSLGTKFDALIPQPLACGATR